MGKVSDKHTSFVEGGRDLAKQLAKIAGVRKVWPGPLTGRGSRKRKLEASLTERSIQVELGVGNGHQSFYVYPENGLPLPELLERVRLEITPPETDNRNTGDRHAETEPEMEEIMPEEPKEAEQPAAETSSEPQVLTRFSLKITPEEALAILEECKNGLPRDFGTGGCTRLGTNFWSALRNHGYVVSVGKGRGAIAETIPERFDETIFVIVDRPGERFKLRITELAPGYQRTRPTNGWLTELRTLCADLPRPNTNGIAPPKSAPSTATSPKLDLTPAIKMLEEMLGHMRRRHTELSAAVAPMLREIRRLDDQTCDLEAKIVGLRQTQKNLMGQGDEKEDKEEELEEEELEEEER